jgi:hypothetical protein
LIDRETNIKISDKAPSKYLTQMDEHGDGVLEILDPHFISGEVATAMRGDDFDKFLAERSKLITAEIERVTTIPKFD